jgi:hypothetical protein
MHRDQHMIDLLVSLHQPVPDQTQMSRWWQNRRGNGGMRTSRWGQDRLAELGAPHWRFDIDPAWITPRNMLRMDRLIPVPYSLDQSNRPRRSWITVWDSGQAMTIELLGDFDRFLAALERAWPRQ